MDECVYLLMSSDLLDNTIFSVTAWRYAQEAVAAALVLFNDQIDMLRPLMSQSIEYDAPRIQRLTDTEDGVAAVNLQYDIDRVVDAVLSGDVVQLRQPYTELGAEKTHWYGVDIWKVVLR